MRAARYMTRFRCLASACEATCCGGGAVPVDESRHRRLTVLSEDDSSARQLLNAGIQLTPAGPAFAQLKFRDDGNCCMLDGEGLCRVRSRFGHDALFEVCATFPRYASRVDGEVELEGSLSCPEVGRLLLLADDAFEVDETQQPPPSLLRNDFETRGSPYFSVYPRVRNALDWLLSVPQLSLSAKLFVGCWLADKLRPVVHVGAARIDPRELEQLFAATQKASTLSSLVQSFGSLQLDGAFALSVLLPALEPNDDARGAQFERFDAIWSDVLAAHQLPPGGLSGASMPALFAQYAARQQKLSPAVVERVEQCLTRVARHQIRTTPYMLHPNLFDALRALVLSVTALRFLIVTRLSHRGIEDAAQLDATLVETAFAFTRRVEHAGTPRRLGQALDQQGCGGLAHCLSFLAL